MPLDRPRTDPVPPQENVDKKTGRNKVKPRSADEEKKRQADRIDRQQREKAEQEENQKLLEVIDAQIIAGSNQDILESQERQEA